MKANPISSKYKKTAVTQNGSMDFPGGIKSTEFTYNDFGALTADPSRGISGITYDNFGNPTRIQFASGQYITNVYSANGEKLKTTSCSLLQQLPFVSDAAELGLIADMPTNEMATSANYGLTKTEYHGPVIYRNGIVDMVLFPGGYTTINGSSVTFHYYTQDYLGNNRAVINGSTGFISQNALRKTHYANPYGGVIANLGTAAITGQPYKFGGKELITANGLNEYDFGARRYYPAVPGFTTIDPLCEDTQWLSPYLYCGNNLVNAIDPDGRSTCVRDLEGRRYNVIGGDLNDKDLNIYVLQNDESGKHLMKGNSIGKSATLYSFYNSGETVGDKGDWAHGAIIDTNDLSGTEFLTGLIKENPSIFR